MRYSSHQRTVSVAYHSVPTPTTSWLPPGTTLLLGGCEYTGDGKGREGEEGKENRVLMAIRQVLWACKYIVYLLVDVRMCTRSSHPVPSCIHVHDLDQSNQAMVQIATVE